MITLDNDDITIINITTIINIIININIITNINTIIIIIIYITNNINILKYFYL